MTSSDVKSVFHDSFYFSLLLVTHIDLKLKLNIRLVCGRRFPLQIGVMFVCCCLLTALDDRLKGKYPMFSLSRLCVSTSKLVATARSGRLLWARWTTKRRVLQVPSSTFTYFLRSFFWKPHLYRCSSTFRLSIVTIEIDKRFPLSLVRWNPSCQAWRVHPWT